jgi:salicylate hydroxylase
MKSQRIVIAGGGIGGLTAAIAIAQAGHRVEVLEQAPALAATVGAGVTLAPNAMIVYRRLGLEDALCALGVEPLRQRVQHWRDGRVLATLERGGKVRELYGAPYLYIHRGDLHAVLIQALKDTGRATFRLGATVTGARVTQTGAAALLQDGDAAEGDIVVAADGIRSPIRKLFEPLEPHFTGHVVWRALAPVEGATLTDLSAFPGVHIGPGRMVVRYPVERGRTLNLVFFARQKGWAQEGWAIAGQRSELTALYGDWAPELGAMIDAIDETRLFKWGVFARTPLAAWTHGGRITLLGDAAHAMTPFLGQGASAAIEDALVLARCLGAAPTPAEALGRYQRARMDRCAFIQAESNANADRMQGDEAHLFGMTEIRNEETLGLFAYDAGAVEI